MKVLSLFDGMSCGRIALERCNIKPDSYFASEIDKHAIKVSKDNWDDITHVGNVKNIKYQDGVLSTESGNFETEIDLLIGGSPCQSFSPLGNREGFEGKSGLFFEYLRILKEVKPKYFLLENVSMKKEWRDKISELIGCEPVEINSNKFSAQNRKRLYWTNIKVGEVVDKNQFAEDVLNIPEGYFLTTKTDSNSYEFVKNKVGCLTTKCSGANSRGMAFYSNLQFKGVRPFDYENVIRLSVEELEKLQTLPVGYTKSVSRYQACKMIGNGWTVGVIAHILKGLI